jgi:hypothetical protein
MGTGSLRKKIKKAGIIYKGEIFLSPSGFGMSENKGIKNFLSKPQNFYIFTYSPVKKKENVLA